MFILMPVYLRSVAAEINASFQYFFIKVLYKIRGAVIARTDYFYNGRSYYLSKVQYKVFARVS